MHKSNKDLLLNKCQVIKYSFLNDNIGDLFARYPNGFFIRPDSWEKFFSGQVINEINYKKALKQIDMYLNHDVDIVISELKEIKEEYGVICINNEIVTASI